MTIIDTAGRAALGGVILLLAGCGQPSSVAPAATGNDAAAAAGPANAMPPAPPYGHYDLTAEQQMQAGLVDMAALRLHVAALGAEGRGVAARFADVDRNADGKLSLAEWTAYSVAVDRRGASAKSGGSPFDRAANAFFHFDLNDDQSLEPDEFDLANAALEADNHG
jgi:hypothetical protein